MKTLIYLSLMLCLSQLSFSQTVSFNKKTLRIDEPYEKDNEKRETFTIELIADKIPASISAVKIEISSESTFPISKVSLSTPTIATLVAKNPIKIDITTDAWSDEEKYILLTANWTINAETRQVKDTLFIKNTYPFKGITEKDYTDWNDGKRAEIFIGTNFDFIDSKVTLSDWYGGARIFLPAITDLRFDRDKSNRMPRFGLAGGIYHAKSLSNFGNPTIDNAPTFVYGRITSYFLDSAVVRYDTTKTKTKTEFNNWGLYVAPLYQWSRFESGDGKFITNIHVGAHVEVIRRNITTSYTFDTIGSTSKNFKVSQIPRNVLTPPFDYIQTFYDAYFGVSMPIQFLWKDILDVKINPCLGIGSRGYSSQIKTKADDQLKPSPYFYLVQFDLLARLGGLRLNIGGEVRGYFPNENPIITAYLGTSFSIQKLVDFVTK
jgi:hypothetical protein